MKISKDSLPMVEISGGADEPKHYEKPWTRPTPAYDKYNELVHISGGEDEPSKSSDRDWTGPTPMSHSGIVPISGGETEKPYRPRMIKKYGGKQDPRQGG